MKVGYFDLVGGASGDMVLAALAGAGADASRIEAVLRPTGIEFGLEMRTEDSGGLAVTRAVVTTKEERAHRRLSDVRELLGRAEAPTPVIERAVAVFEALARAEAEAHGCSVEEIHFHEVGAVDAIVDVFGACLLMSDLGLERVTCSPFPLGRGEIRCAHGVMPAPAPATLNLLKGAPVCECPIPFETVTPTGAAVLTVLCDGYGGVPAMTLERVGIGAGSRRSDRPNWLRLLVGVAGGEGEEETVVGIETNIDDMTPEAVAHMMSRLMAEGALDCFAAPIVMKKGRPATMLTVLASREAASGLARLLLAESSSFGVRFREMSRLCLAREVRTVRTPYGDIRVKVGLLDGREIKAAPEFEDCRAAAERRGVPLTEVQHSALTAHLRHRETLNDAAVEG